MSEDRATRVKAMLKELEGVDAAEHIRGMGRELAATVAEGRRRAEIDLPELTTDVLHVPVMAFENKHGFWKIETLSPDSFPGQQGLFSAVDRNERLAIAEFRMLLAHEMIGARFCRQPEALTAAAKANIDVVGRVPYQRIITTVK